MEIFYHFENEIAAVYLVNGVFFDKLSKLRSETGDVIYITVLPLDALYLPYTVRLGGGGVFANSKLTSVCRLRENRYLVRFMPRFNYVYSPQKHESPKTAMSPLSRFFDAVRQKDSAAARELLTRELSASVDDNSLLSFFDGYGSLIENNGYVPSEGDTFFLIPEEEGLCGEMFRVEYKNGLIDNISEM